MIDKKDIKQITDCVAITKSFKKPTINSIKEHCTYPGKINNIEFHFTYSQYPIQLSYVINKIPYTHQSETIEDAVKWTKQILGY